MQQLVKILLTILFLVYLSSVHAQNVAVTVPVDSVVVKKEKKQRKFLFALDTRRSFVLDRKTKFSGFKIGVEVKEKYRWGLSIYALKKPIHLKDFKLNKELYTDASNPDTVLFNYDYASIFFEPIWFTSRRWELSTHFQLGSGSMHFSYRDSLGNDNIMQEFEKQGPLIGVSGVVEYRLLRWLAFGAGVGYRQILMKDKKARKSVSALIYDFEMKIMLGEIYKMIFKKDELEEW